MPPTTTEETDLVRELRELLLTERGGVRLSSVVIDLLVSHYVQSVMVTDANEVEIHHGSTGSGLRDLLEDGRPRSGARFRWKRGTQVGPSLFQKGS
jgi:hypothetical protein